MIVIVIVIFRKKFYFWNVHFHLNCASCVFCSLFFAFGHLVGLCRMFGFTHDFRHCVETLVPCSLVCLCVGWLNVSLVWGAIHHIVIVWGCICVVSVCMSVFCLCVRFCGDVVKFFALARCVCVGVVQPKSTPAEKTKTNHEKTRKRQHYENIQKQMKTTITKKRQKGSRNKKSQQNHGSKHHEKTKTRKDKITKNKSLEPQTHATDTQRRPWEGMFSRITRKNNVRSNF